MSKNSTSDNTGEGSPPETGSEKRRCLEIGAVYRDNEDGGLYVCADDQPDMQGDVMVINFDGSYGFALFEYPDTDEKIASSLAEYFQNE